MEQGIAEEMAAASRDSGIIRIGINRVLSKDQVAQEMLRNKQKYEIPDEYATVIKLPAKSSSSTSPSSVPPRPPKPSTNNQIAPKKRVCFSDEQSASNCDKDILGSHPANGHGSVEEGEETYGLVADSSFPKPDEDTFDETKVPPPPRSFQDKPITRRTSDDYIRPPRLGFNLEDNNEVTMRPKSSSGRHHSSKSINPSGSHIDFDAFLIDNGNTVSGVLELSTLNQDVISKVKLRVVILIDVSGSMMLKCGRSKQHSKLNKLKQMAGDLVDVLEENEDYLAVVTFGEGPNDVCPLTKINASSRAKLKLDILTVGRKCDNKTDLVAGVKRAIDLLSTGPSADDPAYRNAVLVFSDGEINSGECQSDLVVHAIREKIRKTNPRPQRPLADQWLSVACVTTGSNVSEAMYLVSKWCGNDAYYYVDSSLAHPEVDMLVPLLLRKAGVAQYVSLSVDSDNGAKLVRERCTTDHSIRRKGRENNRQNVTYFLHDMPAGVQKHFSVTVDLENYRSETDSDIMTIHLEYVDILGNPHVLTRKIRFEDRLSFLKNPDKYEAAVLRISRADLRSVFQNTCRDAADSLKDGGQARPEVILVDGKAKLHQRMEYYGQMAKREETKNKVQEFSLALVMNLDKLIESMEKSRRGNGHKWTKIKAVSSAVVREMPNVSKLVAQSETVCPLPVFKTCETNRMTALALKLYRKQEVTSVAFPNQNLFDAAKVVMQSLEDIVDVLNKVEGTSRDCTLRRTLITSMAIDKDDLSDEDK